MLFKGSAGGRWNGGITAGFADGLQRVIGQDAVANALLGAVHQLLDARNLGIERARANQAHDEGNVQRVMRLARRLVGEAKGGEGSGGWLGLPHGFNRCQLHFLVFGGQITALIAQHHHRQRSRQTKRGSDRHRAPCSHRRRD